MKRIFIFVSATLLLTSCRAEQEAQSSLKSAFEGKFYIGAALSARQLHGENHPALEVTRHEFNSVVAENCMKGEVLQPKEGVFNFADADKFIAFAKENNMHIVGHTLIWHQQAPAWFFTDDKGND